MSNATCRVSFRDADGVEYAVTVNADSLYEAAGLGLAEFRRRGLNAAAPEAVREVSVEVRPAATLTQVVPVSRVETWLASRGRGPGEELRKQRIREMLR